MVVQSEACNRVIDVTLEYQTRPLLEMQEKLAEKEKAEEENQKSESKGAENSESQAEVESQQPQKVESKQSTFRVSFSLVV